MSEIKPIDRWDLATRVQESDVDLLSVQPGRIVELEGRLGFGLTRLGYRMLAEPSRVGSVAMVDVRGWMAPQAAWEVGVDRRRLVIVRCGDRRMWSKVIAALCEGVHALYAEVPDRVPERDLRRLAALVRARGVRMVMRPVARPLPVGVAHLRMRAEDVSWSGIDRGHGRLEVRRMTFEASGKGASGMSRRIEMEDGDANAVRVVSPMVARSTGRAG